MIPVPPIVGYVTGGVGLFLLSGLAAGMVWLARDWRRRSRHGRDAINRWNGD